MPQAQLNIRLDEELKRRGDAVLAREGLAAAQAIRSLWSYMAENQRTPAELRDSGRGGESDLESATNRSFEPGLAVRLAKERGIVLRPDDEKGDDCIDRVYADKLADYKRRWEAVEHA